MDRQVSTSALPVFNWSDFHQSQSLLPESTTSDITSLLSARSYLLTESYNSQNAPSSPRPPSYGDIDLEVASYPNHADTHHTPFSNLIAPRPQKRQRCGPKKAVVAKDKGASREIGDRRETPEERRRTQARIAQRAYRSRQQATVDGLTKRISLLESSIEKMSSAVLSLSEQLVQSGTLRAHPALTAHLRDTMQVFFTMAARISHDDDGGGEIRAPADSGKKTLELPPASQQPTITRPSANIPLHLPLAGTGLYPLDSAAVLPHADNPPPGIPIMEVSAFIQKLLLVALHQGHLALRDPSIGMDQLQRPFALVFSMMSRERLTSYFKAELYSQLSHKPLDGWGEVPFFRLGGAGTHYPDTGGRSSGSFVSQYYYYRSGGGTVEDPLSLVTADLQTQLGGDWFDLQDLEGYIRDRNVLLVAGVSAGEPMRSSTVHTSVNVSRFISALISRGVCLGRTPGFQRDDVEEALRFSKVA